VVADKKATGSGRYIEKLGYYDPLKNKEVFVVEKERLLYWTNQGAEISARIKSLLKRHGVLIPPAQEGKRT
jgi:small subunit ribosomal protein S16